ncbi:MAG: septum formation initiator family protein [Lachnospiraceae bacterium]|uniref:septum formation initiator family protein n=1 Tax=uncultured Acetatifactor sp. TaxID=1671927 RepID=UPI00263393FC|nr:septum formation initiator family protein [uncultured Acetatifactor sp.]MCI8787934.1 septum formation initiator family protein [Lachnospiraceae bacterium]
MARKRRVAYRKRQQNRFSMFLVTLVVVMMLVLVGVRSVELRSKIDAKAAELSQLEAQIEAEEERAAEIEALGKEVQTKGYIEDVAREKLGLVYEDEILFKQED